MAEQIWFDVELDGDPTRHRVRILHIDQIVTEREMVRAGLDMETNKVEAATRLAWSAMRRRARTVEGAPQVDDFDTFCEQLTYCDRARLEEEPAEDPTQRAETPGSP